MLIVVFKKTDGTSTSLRPLQSLRFDGKELREAEGGPLLARHEGDGWDVGGTHFLRLDCEGPLRIRFVDASGAASQPHGPFLHFSSVDDIGYADHQFFCHFHAETKRWLARADYSEWTTLIVEKE